MLEQTIGSDKPYFGQRLTAIHIASNTSWRLRLCFLMLETIQDSGNEMESINKYSSKTTSKGQCRRVGMFFIGEGDEISNECKMARLTWGEVRHCLPR